MSRQTESPLVSSREAMGPWIVNNALKWSPNDAEVAKIRADIVAHIEALKKP